MAGEEETPKIIIDSDWKSQAQAEKERLAEAEEKAEPAPQAGQLPPADFRSLIGMLATQAIMYMGGIADRQTGQAVFDPEYARHMIDLLAILQEKTKGNLAEEEDKELTGVLHELRTRFVELAQMIAQQQGAAPPPTPGTPEA
ncbi:MAG: DUF1844 domain-containing protein [Planctomycetota bacterium]